MNIRYFSQVTNPGFVSTYEYVKAEHNLTKPCKKGKETNSSSWYFIIKAVESVHHLLNDIHFLI
jgi:hypothetical protein